MRCSARRVLLVVLFVGVVQFLLHFLGPPGAAPAGERGAHPRDVRLAESTSSSSSSATT
eukprot:m.258904 g.258904  ORF g.258904 m.258904 type:complete len:59 (-) comp22724_c1_seq10:490-666(-)